MVKWIEFVKMRKKCFKRDFALIKYPRFTRITDYEALNYYYVDSFPGIKRFVRIRDTMSNKLEFY